MTTTTALSTLKTYNLTGRMSQYTLYLFELPGCEHAKRVKAHLKTLSPEIQKLIIYTPIKDEAGGRTELAEELYVEFSPTLVVAQLYKENPEDETEEAVLDSVARRVGGKNIIECLPEFLNEYTKIRL